MGFRFLSSGHSALGALMLLSVVPMAISACGSTDVVPETTPVEETTEATTTAETTKETASTTAAEINATQLEFPTPSMSLAELYDPNVTPEEFAFGHSNNDSSDSSGGSSSGGGEEEILLIVVEKVG